MRTLVALSLAAALPTTAAIGDEPAAESDMVTPDFRRLVVRIKPFEGQVEELKIESNGRCWYKVMGSLAPARSGAVFRHQLSANHIRRLNKLLKEAEWLRAKGAEGGPTHTHPATIAITLDRDGIQKSVVCIGRRPEPYHSLLHEFHSLATQERRIYLHDYIPRSLESAGIDAWQAIGREIAALERGDSAGKSPYFIEYDRYLPIARRIVSAFYGEDDQELLPAVRLIGYFKLKSELEFLHRMAHDRSRNLRSEVASALGRIHDERSLPVLTSMMSQAGERTVGFELIKWGDKAVPEIVRLIKHSTDHSLESREITIGENMIRAYLDHWNELERPIDPRVIAAVRTALESNDPAKSIRTEYHRQFLNNVKTQTAP